MENCLEFQVMLWCAKLCQPIRVTNSLEINYKERFVPHIPHSGKIYAFISNYRKLFLLVANKEMKKKQPADQKLTWVRANSRTERILSWSGWKHIPTLPIGWGFVIEVGKCPSQSSLPSTPFHLLWVLSVLVSQGGSSLVMFPQDRRTYSNNRGENIQ